jgi:hypothetical protein
MFHSCASLLLEGRRHDLPSPSYQVSGPSFYKSRLLSVCSTTLRRCVRTSPSRPRESLLARARMLSWKSKHRSAKRNPSHGALAGRCRAGVSLAPRLRPSTDVRARMRSWAVACQKSDAMSLYASLRRPPYTLRAVRNMRSRLSSNIFSNEDSLRGVPGATRKSALSSIKKETSNAPSYPQKQIQRLVAS